MSEVKDNVWKIIFETLKENGIDVREPVNKLGECKSPYVVVKFAGATRYFGYSSQRDLYNFFCYVPKNKYSYLHDFEVKVKSILDSPPLYPMIMPTGSMENDYYDDNLNAHLRMFTYYNNRRVKHL